MSDGFTISVASTTYRGNIAKLPAVCGSISGVRSSVGAAIAVPAMASWGGQRFFQPRAAKSKARR